MQDIYQVGAEALWGSGETVMGGATGEKAAWQAREITENLIQLKNKVNTNSDKFPREYTDALQQFINSWQAFLNSVSGSNIPWYNVTQQFAKSFTAWYNRAEIYNQVQVYGAKYKQLWDLASAKLGESATPTPPPIVKKQISDSPVKDTIADVVKGVVVVAAVIVGGYALINWVGKPKTRAIAQPSAEVEE